MNATPLLPRTKAPWKPDLKAAATFGLLAGLSAIAALPYLRRLTPEAFTKTSLSLPMLAAAQGLQALVLLGLLSLLGLRMGHHFGLGSPLLQGWFGGPRTATPARLRPWHSILLGVLASVVIIGASLVFDPMMPPQLHPAVAPSAAASMFEGLLASFYGGIAEEIQLRLFLMTLVVWMLTFAGRQRPRPALFWLAIVLTAIAFGAGHLPAADKVWGLSSIVVVRTVVLNAVGGLVFGWLYWKRGIEMAMLGHFSADIVLHVATPLMAAALA